MVKNYKLLLIMVACLMFSISCKENKQFCCTLTILTNELIGNVLKSFCAEKLERIMRDVFRKNTDSVKNLQKENKQWKNNREFFERVIRMGGLWMNTQK